MNTLTDRIQAARVEAGLSQTDVAKALRISASAVNQWEQGFTKNIKLEHFFALAKLLGQDPRWLATGKAPSRMREIAATPPGPEFSRPHRRRTRAASLCSPNAQHPPKTGAAAPERTEQHLRFA